MLEGDEGERGVDGARSPAFCRLLVAFCLLVGFCVVLAFCLPAAFCLLDLFCLLVAFCLRCLLEQECVSCDCIYCASQSPLSASFI